MTALCKDSTLGSLPSAAATGSFIFEHAGCSGIGRLSSLVAEQISAFIWGLKALGGTSPRLAVYSNACLLALRAEGILVWS